jgi:signal transduction histidine kinase
MLFASDWAYRSGTTTMPPAQAANEIQQRIPDIAKDARYDLDEFITQYKQSGPNVFYSTNTSSEEFLVFENDSLVFWTGNQAPFTGIQYLKTRSNQITETRAGYYLIITRQNKQQFYTSLVPLVTKYRFNNYYLQNSIHRQLHVDGEYEIVSRPDKGFYPVTYNNNEIFYVGPVPGGNVFTPWHNVLLLLHVGGFFLLTVFLTRMLLLRNAVLHPGQVVLWAAVLVSVRMLMLFGNLFKIEGESAWFNPEIFASGMWAPSLGDFFLNGWCVFFITTTLAGQFEKTSHPALWVRKTAAWVLIPMFVFLSWYVQFSLRTLVQDSGISYTIRDISSFTSYSLLGLMAIGLLLFAMYRLIHAWSKLSADSGLRRGLMWALMSWPLILLLKLPQNLFQFFEGTWAVAGCVLYILLYVRDRKFTLNWLVILLAYFSLVASVTVHRYGIEKEKKNRLLLAEQLSNDEDPETELEFAGFEKKLAGDVFLIGLTDSLNKTTNDRFYAYLDSAYFQRINNHYHVNSFLFDADSSPVFSNLYNPGTLQELTEILSNHSKTGVSASLRLIPNRQHGLLYAGLVSLRKPGGVQCGILAIELRPKIIPEKTGLQELLWHKNQRYRDVVESYSVLQTVNHKVVLRTGNFVFDGDLSEWKQKNQKFEFFDNDYASHLIYYSRPGHITVVSYPHTNWLARATSFSYVFIIFIVLFSTLLLVLRWQKWNIRHISLRGKIQLSLIVLLLVAMILLAAGTRYIIGDQYREKNLRLLSEKLESAATELQNKIANNTFYNEDDRNYIGYLLARFSRIFHCDIHYYDLRGQLVASSLPELFRFGIVSGRMNQQAFIQLKNRHGSDFVHNEQISSLGYLSGYKPFYSINQKVAGYINIPFFAPRASVDSEISSIVMAILNIFVVLFVLALAASLVFTQIITAPLRKIQGSLASIQLNQVNQPILYSGKDEIADLVKEYNRKVAELELYATELARSERETAWREMARQVAHEIKNPLTPMKLNIQHMQRTLKHNDPELEQKVEKLTRSLIEQINILTHIADDFSNMAKMPLARMEIIELTGLIENVIELFSDIPHVKIKFVNTIQGAIQVKADRDQLVRVFNNLVKNATQAIPEDASGIIEVHLSRNNDYFHISITDNGIGIPVNLRDRIFKPNFTTKSTGTGLGLAMVKSIIEQHGGQIWFDSEPGKGTIFTFTLPVVNN